MDQFFCGLKCVESTTNQHIPTAKKSRSVVRSLLSLRQFMVSHSHYHVGFFVSIIHAARAAFVIPHEPHSTEAGEHVEIKLACHSLNSFNPGGWPVTHCDGLGGCGHIRRDRMGKSSRARSTVRIDPPRGTIVLPVVPVAVAVPWSGCGMSCSTRQRRRTR